MFENDYAALKPLEVEYNEDGEDLVLDDMSARHTEDDGRFFPFPEATKHPLLRSTPTRGRCYVMCFHPSHNLTLAQLSSPPFSAGTHILPIVNAWRDLYHSIARENPFVRYIQIFENKGSSMGCSNPHPHGQIWSLDYIPEEPGKVLRNLKAYALDPANASNDAKLNPPKDEKGRPSLLLTYATIELSTPGRPRVVADNAHFVAVVPYWAVWPFEVMILPRARQIPSVAEMDEQERLALAEMLGEVACRLDNIFECSFPYSMGIHQRPVPAGQAQKGEEADDLGDFAQFHIHYYPPLLRSATVRKFLVG